MAITYTYPGVYIEESSQGPRAITGVATSVGAFVGWFPTGPIGVPVLVTSWSDVENKLGGLHADSDASYALWLFFRNGGTQAWVVRVADNSTPQAATMIGPPGSVLTITARDPGKAGNAISVTVTHTQGSSDLFSLRIEQPLPSTTRTETFAGLTMSSTGPGQLPTELRSELVTFAITGGGTRPNESTDALANGDIAGEIPTGAARAAAYEAAVAALDRVPIYNLLCLPGLVDGTGIGSAKDALEGAAAACRRRRALLLVDSPHDGSSGHATMLAMMNGTDLPMTDGEHVAVYFPWLEVADPLAPGSTKRVGPSGAIAGLAARTDAAVGVWKAPAGTDYPLAAVSHLTRDLTDTENGVLNVWGLNCIRRFPGTGHVCWGARTLKGADHLSNPYKYVPVRRLASFIGETLYRSTQWVVFQPNNEILWRDIRISISGFMQQLYRQGAFVGATPDQAFFVRCDAETTTPLDQDRGIVNVVVGFAPAKPAEFVVIQIQQIQQTAS